MRVLFAGDSITRGTSGVSFVLQIKRRYPTYQLTNLGVNGDTLNVIAGRLLHQLKVGEYDCVVLQGGYNDLLLPHFNCKGRLFKYALDQQLRKGMRPLHEADDFGLFLRKTVQQVKQVFKGKIILTTLGCIHEDLSFSLNEKRRLYNEAIRQVSYDEGVMLADCGAHFDERLREVSIPADYLLKSFWAVTAGDPLICQLPCGARWLSKRRRLLLIIDGVHLNEAGAQLFSEEVADAIG